MDQAVLLIGWLRWPVLLTYLIQTILIVGLPVPSPVSSIRLVMNRQIKSPDRKAGIKAVGLAAMAAGALAAALVPLSVCLHSPLCGSLTVFRIPSANSTALIAAGSMVAGNTLTVWAAVSLRRESAFDPGGESDRLLTRGIYGMIRHPIVAGMGLIYLGLFLVVPSPWVLAGLLLYIGNQLLRVNREERLLANRFGQEYIRYSRCVGRFFPKISGSGRTKINR